MWWNKKKENQILPELVKKIPGILQDVPLSDFSYIKMGGKAQYYFESKNREDLIRAVRLSREFNLPHIIIGNASNILFPDEGFLGLVIKNNYASKEAIVVNGNEVLAPSGISLLVLIKELGQRGLGGIEFMAPIPGTLAAAVVNNIGASGKEMKDFLLGANILDFDGKIKFITKDKLGLSYRHSKLKGLAKVRHYKKYPVILEVKLKLMSRGKEEVDRLVQSLFLTRAKSQGRGLSLGCVFRNPKIDFNKHNFPKEVIRDGRISSGYLLEQIGFKNKRRGKIKISREHANFFINLGGGKASDYQLLINEAKDKVKEKYGLELKEEIEIIE